MLRRVLKSRNIEFVDSENIGELRRRLRSHITTLRKGKQSEWSRNQRAESELERDRRLNEIRNEWPQPASMELKEDCIRNFRAATSSESLRQFTCACCAESINISVFWFFPGLSANKGRSGRGGFPGSVLSRGREASGSDSDGREGDWKR